MMKVLAKERYAEMYPDDPQAAVRAFASFMGYFGQTTNSISFLFSLFGTGAVIKNFGFTNVLIAFPVLLLICSSFVWISPTIWVVFGVMMVIKGMSYALNNPTKEILYQATSTNIKFKCKSWIDTFGQRSAKAGGSLITNACASNLADLNNYGFLTGAVMSCFLIWVSKHMGELFEKLQGEDRKVGEESESELAAAAEVVMSPLPTSDKEKESVDV
jgi:AAA family ATP:ADP antiporter